MYRMLRIRSVASVLIVAAAMLLSATVDVAGADGGAITALRESAVREQLNGAAGSNVDLAGRLIYGPCRAVAVDGDMLYFGNGYSLEIFMAGISPPYSRTGMLALPGMPRHAVASGDYVYLSFAADRYTGYDGLYVVDVSDASHPVVIGTWAAPGGVNGMALSGDFLYVAVTDEQELSVIDVSDPANPSTVSSVGTEGYPYGVTLSGNYAFVAAAGDELLIYSGLEIIDITDPLNPLPAGNASASGNLLDVAVAGGYAFGASSHYSFEAYEVSNPSNPGSEGFMLPLTEGTSIETNGQYLYITNCYVRDLQSGLAIYDISDFPTSIPPIVTYGMPGCPVDLAIQDNTAFIANAELGVHVLDISEPIAPVEVWRRVTGGRAHAIALSGSYAFVADDVAGLRVVDASDHAAPVLIGSYFTGENMRDVAIHGDYAYLAVYGGLRVIDISDPSVPTEAGYIETGGDSWNVAVSGSYAYIADLDCGLRVIDVGDPVDPVQVGIYEIENGCYTVDVVGDYAYIRPEYPDVALFIINVSDKSNPQKVGSCDLNHLSFGIHAEGDYVYVTLASLGPAGVSVIDVEDPANPFEAGRLEWEGYPMWGITVHGGIAYVADEFFGLRMVDISDPTDPVLVGGHATDDIASDVAVSDDGWIFFIDQYAGLYIFESALVATQLASYSASFDAEHDGIALTWTLSEITERAEFVVLRSRDVGSGFEEINGAGIRQDGFNFRYLDREIIGGESYTYRLDVLDDEGCRTLFVTEPIATPAVPLALEQNHPNPFNPTTTLKYYLPRDCDVTLEVFDVTGRRVAVLARGNQRAGSHSVVWNGTNAAGDRVASGIYFYRLKAGKDSITKKMVLMQ